MTDPTGHVCHDNSEIPGALDTLVSDCAFMKGVALACCPTLNLLGVCSHTYMIPGLSSFTTINFYYPAGETTAQGAEEGCHITGGTWTPAG